MPEMLTNLFVSLQEPHDTVWFTFILTFVLFVIENNQNYQSQQSANYVE